MSADREKLRELIAKLASAKKSGWGHNIDWALYEFKEALSPEVVTSLLNDSEALETSERQAERLTEALRFYADKQTWAEHPTRDHGMTSDGALDGGKRAREALEET